MSGRSQALARGDMFVEDAEGVLSAVLHGPDARTKIETTTTAALYVVYAPQGVTRMAIVAHLDDIRENVSLFSPGVEVTRLEVLGCPDSGLGARLRRGCWVVETSHHQDWWSVGVRKRRWW